MTKTIHPCLNKRITGRYTEKQNQRATSRSAPHVRYTVGPHKTMIHEATHWKEELLDNGTLLAKIANQRMYGHKTKVMIEKSVFVTFYVIRKLIDNGHLPPTVAKLPVAVDTHPRRREEEWSNDVSLGVLYDLNQGRRETRSVREIANQFIHSVVFVIQMKHPMEMIGFHVSSDRDRDKHCLYVSLPEVLRVYAAVGSMELKQERANKSSGCRISPRNEKTPYQTIPLNRRPKGLECFNERGGKNNPCLRKQTNKRKIQENRIKTWN